MTSVALKNFADLNANERTALLTLLEDEDPAIQDLLVDQLVSYGPAALEWLQPSLSGRSGVIRRRFELIKEQLGRQENDASFLKFCIGSESDMDLEDGLWRLARSEFPSISIDGYRALIDSFAEVLKDRLDSVDDGEGRFAMINHYLFDELEFSGNEENYYDPQNSYLNRVIDRRLGIPITLSVVLLLISDRLNLPVTGIGMPGHFLCRYQTSREEFYIDAFNRGRLLSKAECVRFLNEGGAGFKEEYLSPVSSRAIMIRICRNLVQIHRQNEDADMEERIGRYVTALSRKR
jgi:regulator of sirC expression with transglutaminase-like and TPR domain